MTSICYNKRDLRDKTRRKSLERSKGNEEKAKEKDYKKIAKRMVQQNNYFNSRKNN